MQHGICCSHRLIIERCTIGCEGWAWALCTTELPTTGFAAQTKEERKTKGWDEKEAIGNELLGNAFWGNDAKCTLQRGRQRNLRFWVHSSFAFATSETSVSGHATGLQASTSRSISLALV